MDSLKPRSNLDEPLPETAMEAAPASPGTRQLAVNVLAGGTGNIVKVVIQIVMLPLMARLLGPAEFGLFGLALPTVVFFTILADAGMGVSLARERTQSTSLWSTAFWLMVGVGILLAIIVTSWGFVIAQVSGEPKIRPIMGTLSLSLIFLTLSVLPSARITQQGRLFILVAADVTATLIGSAVAIIMAVYGAGAMSLAAQYVSSFLVRAVILNKCAFVRPTWEFNLSEIMPHMSLGVSIISGRLTELAGRLTENLIYGRMLGVAALGMFTFANQIPRFLSEAASNPIWAALYAHSLRDEGDGAAKVHLKLTFILSLILTPIAFILPPVLPILVDTLLGQKWQEASTLLQILIPFYILSTISAQSTAILLARGMGWTIFKINLTSIIGRVIAVCLGVFVGPVAVVIGICIVYVLFSILVIAVSAKCRVVQVGPLLFNLTTTGCAAAVAGLGCWLILGLLPPTLLGAGLAMAGGFGLYGLILIIIDGRRVVGEIRSIVTVLYQRP